MLLPDNFLYFIILFFISIFGGTYLLFSYYRDRLLLVNALMFYCCAIRACTEHYLPNINLIEQARWLAIFHSLVAVLIGCFQWYCIWYYIRPFQNWKYEKVINQIYLWGILITPSLIRSYWLIQRKIFQFYPTKIDGYWMSAPDITFPYIGFYFSYTVWMTYLMVGVFVISIYKNSKYRVRQLLLLISFVIIPYLFFSFFEGRIYGQYTVPNISGLLVAHVLIISWFLTDYRIFKNSFEFLTKDLLNSVSELTISTNKSLKINYLNDKATYFFQFRQGDLLGLLKNRSNHTIAELEYVIQLLLTQEKEEIEVELFDKDKTIKIFNLKVAPFKKNGHLLGYTWLLSDLTQIRKNEQELVQLNETKDRLFAIIGHDLRKPALAFRGISKKINFLLKEQDFFTLREIGKSLDNSALMLNKLLDNLLSWSLQQRNVLPYNPIYFELSDILIEIESLFSPLLERKNITYISEISQTSQVFMDVNATTTIVRNLIDNAIKFTPVGGEIKVEVKQLNNYQLMKIIDTGEGITKEQQSYLFELKQNKSKKGTLGEKGTGLGLPIVKELVKLNKGKIEVESDIQQGTIFYVFLPLKPEKASLL